MSVDSLKKLRTKVLNALWDGRSSRVPELLMALVFKGHRCDPVQVVAFRALATFHKMCLKRPSVALSLRTNWQCHLDQPESDVWGPAHMILRAVQFIGWSWDQSFERFERRDWPSITWKACSKSWFLHEVRCALKQSQILLASARCQHLNDFTFLDKPSTVKLLRHLLKSKNVYLAGTLKAILANAIKTAVVFHKSKLVNSPICPFCTSRVLETNHHLFNECPAWASIREPFNPDVSFQHLPTCTMCVGVACIPVATLHLLKEMAASDFRYQTDTDFLIDSFPDFETFSGVSLSVWLGTHMMHSSHPFWKRCGFGVIFDSARQHPHTMFDCLRGPDQTEIRAFACGLMFVLCRLPRAIKIHVSNPQFLQFWNSLCDPNVFPSQFDHHDLVRPIRTLLTYRTNPIDVCLVPRETHPDEFAAAHAAARSGAELYRSYTFDTAFEAYLHHQQRVQDRQQMMLDILIARDTYARKHKLLTYAPKTKRVPFSQEPVDQHEHILPTSQVEYLVHPRDFQGFCHKLGHFPAFSRSLRFSFGEPFFNALVWYLQQLRFPDTDAISTKGITFIELCMDFELSSGIILPGAASRRTTTDGQRWRRGASCPIAFVQDKDLPDPTNSSFLEHKLRKISNGSKVPRFECSACLRSGNWAERSRFLKHSCAGRPESKSDAVRRHRLQQERSKVQTKSILSSDPVPLGERALVFGDGFRSLLQKSPPQTFDILQHSTHVCRSLSGFSLPPSSGLLRRPILLFQDTISEEISVATTHFHLGQWAEAAQWHSCWFPQYDQIRPPPLWHRPREPD